MHIFICYIFIGFIIGFLITYAMAASPKIIIKYPTTENIGKTTYIDERGYCYKYFIKNIPCPRN